MLLRKEPWKEERVLKEMLGFCMDYLEGKPGTNWWDWKNDDGA